MTYEYRLILAGHTRAHDLAARALPATDERPSPYRSVLSRDLNDRYGFSVTVWTENDGYVEADGDAGSWVWEPGVVAEVDFDMAKDGDLAEAVNNVLGVVRRVLDTGPEDVAFVLNNDYLIFTRMGGVLRRHHLDVWWRDHPFADALIRGSNEP